MLAAYDYVEEQLDLFEQELKVESRRHGHVVQPKFRVEKLTDEQAKNILVGFLRESFDQLQDLATLPINRVEIMRWVMDKSRTDIFGFDNIAVALGLEPKFLRDSFLNHGLKDIITT
jgi:hypothetical protein